MEDKLAEYRESALVEGVGDDPPLEVVEGTPAGIDESQKSKFESRKRNLKF